jgi:hypothetical protein
LETSSVLPLKPDPDATRDLEQHGFRRAENIKRCLDAELYFYVTLLLRSGLRF